MNKRILAAFLAAVMIFSTANITFADNYNQNVKISELTDLTTSDSSIFLSENGNEIELSDNFLEESNKRMLDQYEQRQCAIQAFSASEKSEKQVDLVFVIDSTGSMYDAIANVKANIASFAQDIEMQGLSLRIALIDYKDITVSGEEDSVVVHKLNYSPWYSSASQLISELSHLSAEGGSDTAETAVEALGVLTQPEQIMWGSSAYKFAFLITDAPTKTDNTYGYGGIEQLADKLKELNIVTSVITSSSSQSSYTSVVESTGGIFANIYSNNFEDTLLSLANSIINEVSKGDSLNLTIVDLNDDPVPYADVNIYNGTDLYRTKQADENGAVSIDISDIPEKLYCRYTVSASKEITSGDALSGSNRNKLFNQYIKNSAGENIRYRYELHSETIDTNGNWVGVKLSEIKNNSELALKEPRMLVSLSVAYLADNGSINDDVVLPNYYDNLKTVMNNVAQNVAQTTDGHILIDKVYIFDTANRNDFYLTKINDSQADVGNASDVSMADIRIESLVYDDGEWLFNVKIHSNSDPSGFYDDTPYYTEDKMEDSRFKHLKNYEDIVAGKASFCRVQLGGSAHEGSYNIYDTDVYAKTITHELGHYLMTFKDEYLTSKTDDKGNKLKWRELTWVKKPIENFGLMDYQYTEIEMSKAANYEYLTNSDAIKTVQAEFWNCSCEEQLAKVLQHGLEENIYDTGGLPASYDYADNGEHRRAEYSYAALDDSDFIDLRAIKTGGSGAIEAYSNEPSATSEKLADIAINGKTLEVAPIKVGTVSVYERNANSSEYAELSLSEKNGKYYTTLQLDDGRSTEIKVVVANDTEALSNYYYIEKSFSSEKGYVFTDINNSTQAYVVPEGKNQYDFIAHNFTYTNGDYSSVNQSLEISSANKTAFTGEIYSVASINDNIDYSSVSWFKYADGKWTQLATDISNEENMNIGARADLQGEGVYVLMAKESITAKLNTVNNLTYKTAKDRDGVIYLSFNDTNDSSLIGYYDIYYSDIPFNSVTDEGVHHERAYAGQALYLLDLTDRNKTSYVGIVAIGKDGSASDISKIITVTTGEADRDDDGIPDWWCDKYLLWGDYGKDIAAYDDDNDGLTNLEEYQLSSDPTDPYSPVYTEIVPVNSINIKSKSRTIAIGSSTTLTAGILPANATNKGVNWYVDDASVVQITPKDTACIVTGLTAGTATITAVSLDGGYTSEIEIIVNEVVESNYSNGKSSSKASVIATTTTEKATEATTSALTDAVKVTIGKKAIIIGENSYNMDVAPYIQDSSNSTMIPLRFVSLAICGGDIVRADNSNIIAWDSISKTATINANDNIIKFTAGSNIMLINNKPIVMEYGVKAEISNGRMFIPFRALGKALGVNVEWDAETKTAIYR